MKCPKCQSDNLDTSRFCANCGTQLLVSKEMLVSPAQTLEMTIEELGKGGMGRVYRSSIPRKKRRLPLSS